MSKGLQHMYHGERFNAWTHLVGAVLATIGAVWLLVLAGLGGDPRKIVGVAIYGFSLVVLYSISTLYHSLRGRAKVVLRKLDHLSIYLMIAGSYTPFCLVTLQGAWGWTLFGIVWGLAVIGMLNYLAHRHDQRVYVSNPAAQKLSPLTLRALDDLTNTVKIVCFYDRREPLFGVVSALLKEYQALSSRSRIKGGPPGWFSSKSRSTIVTREGIVMSSTTKGQVQPVSIQSQR